MSETRFCLADRNIRILERTGDVIFRHVAMKGYELLVTHAEPKYRQPEGADARLRTRCRASGRRDGRPRAVHRAGQANIACAGGHKLRPIPKCCSAWKGNGISRVLSRGQTGNILLIGPRETSLDAQTIACRAHPHQLDIQAKMFRRNSRSAIRDLRSCWPRSWRTPATAISTFRKWCRPCPRTS